MPTTPAARATLIAGAAGLSVLLVVAGYPVLTAITLGCLGAVLAADVGWNGLRSSQSALLLAIVVIAGFALARML